MKSHKGQKAWHPIRTSRLPNSLSHECLCTTSSPPTPPKKLTIWKQPCLGQGPKGTKSQKEFWRRLRSTNIIRISHKNITARHKPHTLSQSAMGVHSISRILQYHLSTIFTSHLHHQPKLQTEPSNHNRMSSRHVKSFSNTRIDLLPDIAVAAATSHWLRSRLKASAWRKTVARKEGPLHSEKSTIKEGRRTLIKILWQLKEGQHSLNYIHHSTNPNPEWTSLNHNSMFRSRYVILKHTYRLDVMHAGEIP